MWRLMIKDKRHGSTSSQEPMTLLSNSSYTVIDKSFYLSFVVSLLKTTTFVEVKDTYSTGG